ncbi:type I restriction enzyme HsdR N-terminal domain-containing protein [Maridesulfovibrio sp.]|uniref:type I restriction enzyme HsdR N-terminal domain-containing protein n=1 Tax=Maridesulfovibrio sp. TaxID=2795000 RepID=UPI0039EF0104
MSNNATEMTEASFEANLNSVLKAVFPWAGTDALTHQETFTIRLGHKDISVEGKSSLARGRFDILIKQGDTPLAILELKRPDIELQEDDVSQGLSYSRLLSPPAPLLIVSNGNETHLYETYTGKKIDDSNIQDEQRLTTLISNSAELAKKNKEYAIKALLGPNDQIWQKIFDDLSMEAFNELIGEMPELLKPLVQGFSIPRTITPQILDDLKSQARLMVIHGPPMSGKTNVLAELYQFLNSETNFIPLFIEADDYSEGILRIIANRLSSCIGFSFDKEQVRTWLRGFSNNESGPSVVLIIDEVSGTNFKEELTELTSTSYGGKLKFVIAINDGDPDSLLYRGEHRRKATPLSRRAKMFQIAPLDDVEIKSAAKALYDQRVLLEKGYHHTVAYRSPWLLRSLGADAVASLKNVPNTMLAGIPPILGLNFFDICGMHFASKPEMKLLYKKLANAIIEEHQEIDKYHSEILNMLHMYLVHENTIKKHFKYRELKELEKEGLLKKHLISDKVVYIPRLQEYLAFELSRSLGEQLYSQIDSSPDAVEQLSRLSGTIPFGDIIAANAILSCSNQKPILSNFFYELIKTIPKRNEVKEGFKGRILLPGDHKGNAMEHLPMEFVLPYAPEDPSYFYEDINAWLILSHLASMPIVGIAENGSHVRIDTSLLVAVGSCPFPLLRPQSTNQAHHTHNFPNGDTYLCGKDGLIEPITLSICKSMAREQSLGTKIIQKALEKESLALLMRISIALYKIIEMNDHATSTWAQKQLGNNVSPTLSKLLDHAIYNSSPLINSPFHED